MMARDPNDAGSMQREDNANMANPAMEAASLIAKAAALPFSTLPIRRDCAIFLIIMTRSRSPVFEPHGNRCVEPSPKSGIEPLFADSADCERAKLNRGIRDRCHACARRTGSRPFVGLVSGRCFDLASSGAPGQAASRQKQGACRVRAARISLLPEKSRSP